MELVEITQDTLDDIWKQAEHEPAYPETRMKHLLEVISGTLGRYVQRKLGNLDFWKGQYGTVHKGLEDGLSLCEQWTAATDELTMRYWKQYKSHPWKSGQFTSESLTSIQQRIEEVHGSMSYHTSRNF